MKPTKTNNNTDDKLVQDIVVKMNATKSMFDEGLINTDESAIFSFLTGVKAGLILAGMNKNKAHKLVIKSIVKFNE